MAGPGPKELHLAVGPYGVEVQDFGEGKKAVLFLHGNPGGKEEWAPLAAAVAKAGYRCLVPDRPGHGETDGIVFNKDAPWIQTDIYSGLIDQMLGQGRVAVVGYSFGCFMALRLAARKPTSMAGLALLAPFVAPRDPGEAPSKIPMLARVPVVNTVMGMFLPLLARGKLQDHLEKVFFPGQAPAELFGEILGRITSYESIVAAMNDRNELAATWEAVQKTIPAVTVPVLAIGGRKDAICTSEDHVKRVTDGVKNAKAVMLDDAGHGLPFTHGPLVESLLLEHLGKCF